MFYFALGLKIFQRSKLIRRRDFAVNSMELEEINALETQAVETSVATGAQIFRAAVGDPFIRAGAFEARFGGDHQSCRVGVERLGNDFFADAGAVGISGIYKINSQGDGAVKDADSFVAVLGFAPNAFAGKAHGAKTEPVDAEVSPNQELSRFCGGKVILRLLSGCCAHVALLTTMAWYAILEPGRIGAVVCFE
jgi:hypothetical protein